MSNTTLRTLRDARRLISKPEAWCKGYNYLEADADDPQEKWCALGAIVEVCEDAQRDRAYEVLSAIAKSQGVGPLTGYNDADSTTHQDILDLFDYAIEQLLEDS